MGGGVQNGPKNTDVINERPLIPCNAVELIQGKFLKLRVLLSPKSLCIKKDVLTVYVRYKANIPILSGKCFDNMESSSF